ncbi:rRNA maturation RNase YbeY [Sulfurospirillum sp. 1612]|uniref:rRNA maturation RNase YbeY n=1 Tax=Sulfurospirillum sp. 1612 TaxID=3094835 RepID=UPI003FCCFEF2
MMETIAQSLSDKDIELMIVGDDEMKLLNKQTRGLDQSTDVLSFPLEPMEHVPLGSIIINEKKVKEVALALGHQEQEEVTLLFIHGLLHLVGYDHETDDGAMREKEKEIITAYHLPKSLIVRTEG